MNGCGRGANIVWTCGEATGQHIQGDGLHMSEHCGSGVVGTDQHGQDEDGTGGRDLGVYTTARATAMYWSLHCPWAMADTVSEVMPVGGRATT